METFALIYAIIGAALGAWVAIFPPIHVRTTARNAATRLAAFALMFSLWPWVMVAAGIETWREWKRRK